MAMLTGSTPMTVIARLRFVINMFRFLQHKFYNISVTLYQCICTSQ